MSHTEFDSIYIDLKGTWTSEATRRAAEAVTAFFDLRGHNGEGDPDLDDCGSAYVYDTDINTDLGLDALCAVLEEGPAFTLIFDASDGLSTRTLVHGPGVAPRKIFDTVLAGEVMIPLSRVDDAEFIAEMRAAMAISEMGYTLADA